MLEKVHRFAARLLLQRYDMSYDGLLKELSWKPIARITTERQLILAWKYYSEQRFLPPGTLLHYPIPSRLRRGWGRHDCMLVVNDKIFCGAGTGRTDRKTQGINSLYRLVQLWNALAPDHVAQSLTDFKHVVKSNVFYDSFITKCTSLGDATNL